MNQPQHNSAFSCPSPPRVVLTCAVLDEEVMHYAQAQPNLLHIEVMPQGLHNDPPKLRRDLQAMVDQLERRFAPEAIVLVYGLCSRGTEGVVARNGRLVIARAHDCITHLLGDRQRYAQYVAEHPGTYWYSTGWNKHHIPPGQERYDKLHQQYVEQYGADNAEYLMETEQHWFQTYDRATFVDLTVRGTEPEAQYTRKCADWLKWDYDYQRGDPSLLRDLLSGPWDHERFVVCEPGQSFRLVPDDRVLEPVPLSETATPPAAC